MTQNDKKFLSWLISQEPYIIWLSFMLHICKLISSGVFFFNFSKFWFSGSVKMAKNGPKWQKIVSVSFCFSGTVHHTIVIFGAHF